jgi:hypothetical protein
MFWLIVTLSASFKLAAAASIASAALIGILGILGRNIGIRSHRRRTQFYGPDAKLFPFREALPKIRVTSEKALAATSPALAITDLGNVSLYELRQLILSIAWSALRLVGHMDGFCLNNTANNSPVIAHDKVDSVGCRFGVTAQE